MSKVTYVYVQCIEMLHRGYGMGHRECLRYTYMASASDEGCGDVNQFYLSFGLADRYLILMGTRCYRVL